MPPSPPTIRSRMPPSATTSIASLLVPRSPLPGAAPIRLIPPPRPSPLSGRRALNLAMMRPRVSCQVSLTADDISSSSSSSSARSEEEAAKVGNSIRVKVPLMVYHVGKASELDLNGLEGVVKQHVGLWKGKRVSANLPYKVEFHIEVAGQPRPTKFFAHLREEEFELLPED